MSARAFFAVLALSLATSPIVESSAWAAQARKPKATPAARATGKAKAKIRKKAKTAESRRPSRGRPVVAPPKQNQLSSIAAATPAPIRRDERASSASLSAAKLPGSGAAIGSDELTGEEFRGKLSEMLDRTEKSIKLIREQIVQSQTAPFLGQLYMQLAELLSQKSNTLYYIQMEKQKLGAVVNTDKALSPVVAAQTEAVSIYRLVLRDFPDFDRRPQAMFRLALALKSIEENAEFTRVTAQLLKEYPSAEEAMRARLLLAQHFFDAQQLDEAMRLFQPVAAVKFPYERNMAKYRIGLIHIAKDRFREALTQFEQVIEDPELKEQENPYQISLKKRSFKADLKRDALIDSIRAYTHVFKTGADPVAYYSRLAPTEVHFQEVIEKLAVRYLNLKKYNEAVKLLRTLSERTADAQKVISIYQEVMLMIPIKDRVQVPVSEIRYLLDKYNTWSNVYDIAPEAKLQAFNFFEKQVRDLGTTAHSYAKAEKNRELRARYLARALEFYLLYIGYFDRSPNTVKLATNTADVYYALGDFYNAGNFYLRVFSGEFGKPASGDLRILIENAILCLQKKGNYAFYENVRAHGLLIQAIQSYQAFDPKRRNDPKLAFALVKAEFEQGFFPEALEHLFDYMSRFRSHQHALDAGELILDYFNTRNEFAALENWSNRMLGLKLPSAAFNAKLGSLKKQARSKVLTEKVKTVAAYDEFAQGKSYLEAALAMGDDNLSNEALKQALARSRAERDINTFLSAAQMMADKEPDLKKKGAIIRSMAREHLRATRFKAAILMYEDLARDAKYSRPERASFLEEAANSSLLLRDWGRIAYYLASPLSAEFSSDLRGRIREQVKDVLSSPVEPPSGFAEALTRGGINEEVLLILFKAQYRLEPAFRARVLREIGAHCGAQSRQLICRWANLDKTDARLDEFGADLGRTPKTLPGIESAAQKFAGLSGFLQGMEGTGDPVFETALSMRSAEAYRQFGRYLSSAAAANPELRPVLLAKAQDAATSAKLYLDRCRSLGARSAALKPRSDLCQEGEVVSLKELFTVKMVSSPSPPRSDPSGEEFEELRRGLFAGKPDPDAILKLALAYYKAGHLHHAAATAAYGLGSHKQAAAEFKTVLGCSVLEFGLYDEAAYHLRTGASLDGLREKCQARVGRAGGA